MHLNRVPREPFLYNRIHDQRNRGIQPQLGKLNHQSGGAANLDLRRFRWFGRMQLI